MIERDYKGEVLYNDNRIHDIAVYATTGGLAIKVKSQDIIRKMNEFKRLLKSGEFANIDELEYSVYERFGVLGADNKSGITEDDLKHCQDMYDEFNKRDEEKEEQI